MQPDTVGGSNSTPGFSFMMVEKATCLWCLAFLGAVQGSDFCLSWLGRNGSMAWISGWRPLRAVGGVEVCEKCREIGDPWVPGSMNCREIHRKSKILRSKSDILRELNMLKSHWVYGWIGRKSTQAQRQHISRKSWKSVIDITMSWFMIFRCMEPIWKEVAACLKLPVFNKRIQGTQRKRETWSIQRKKNNL